MYFDADHFYGRILEVEKSANKSFPDYKRGIAKVRKMMANEPNIDAVKVVRCGECARPLEDCPFKDCVMLKTDFCSYGERRESEVTP